MHQPKTTDAKMTCRGCSSIIPQGFRLHYAGEVACCSKECANRFAHLELARFTRWLKHIASRTSGKASDYAGLALRTNMEPF